MATIKISELYPTGYELFQDAETFLNELTEKEINSVAGGEDIQLLLADAVQGQNITIFSQTGPYAASITAKTVISAV